MAVVDMRVTGQRQDISSGKVWHETVILESPATESDIYLLPVQEIYAVDCIIDGTGTIQFTIDSDDTIRENPGSITWETWDGLSQVNFGVVAFQVTRSSGTVTAKITVRTRGR